VFLLLLMSGVAAMLWWLVSPRLGTPCHWADAPGGELSFRLRFGSPLAALLWFGRRGDCGLALLGVVHIREQTVTRSLLAHELGHLVRMRADQLGYLLRYVLIPSYRAAEESACWDFAAEHHDDAVIRTLAR